MPQLTDHLLVAVLVFGLPLYAKFIWFPRLKALPERGQSAGRIVLFAQAIIMQWALAAIAILSWQVFGRSLTELGLSAPSGWRFYAAAAAALVVLTVAARQDARGVRDPEFREQMLAQLRPVSILLPRSALERVIWILVSVTAGVCEELLYRGLLVWYLGSYLAAPVAWVVAVVIFGWGHFYQGRSGMIQTAIVGAMLLALYVISGSLWISMVLHTLIDVNSGLFGAWVLRRADEAKREEPSPAAD